MKTFTEKELKKSYPNHKTDLCYMVAESYYDIDAETFTTDELDEAKEEAKQDGYHVYVFTKKLMKDCFDADCLLYNLVDNVEQEGVDSDWLYGMLSDLDKKNFCSFVTKWFGNVVGNSYFADELIGELELEK